MKKFIAPILIAIVLTAFLISARRPADTTSDSYLAVLSESNKSLERFTLDNGMICLVKEDRSAPVVSIQFWVGTGAIHENEYLGSGLSHAIEHMIFKGTKTRDPGDISRELSDAGGNINAYTGYDRTVFYVDMPSREWKVGLDVLSDAIMNPDFPEDEWTREKEVIIREIAMGHDDPNRVISKLLFNTSYRVHPYKYPVIGYEDTFRKVSRDDLVTFFKRNYVSDNITAVIVGDINSDEIKDALTTTFAEFKRSSRAPVILPDEPKQLSPRFQRKTGDYNISRLEWAYHSVPLNHADAAALDVLAIIVGQGRTSRLSRKIKEELKLAHSIGAWSYTPKEPGIFAISAEFDPDKEDALISAVQEEIESWLLRPFSNDEIEKAKRRLLTSELSALQTMNGQASSYASGEFYAGDPNFSETYLAKVNKITPNELLFTARKYLEPQKRSLVILSPEKEETATTESVAKTVTTPKILKHNLSNNTTLLTMEDNKLPFVYFCVAGKGGLLSENADNNGITSIMSELLTRGTESMSADDIALMSESRGGSVSTFSGRNSFGIQAKCLSGDIEIFMKLISECLATSTFTDDELQKQKSLQAAELQSKYEQPFYIARSTMSQTIFPDHPYRWDELGTMESIDKISREDIHKHAKKLIVSDNLVLSVFGNADAKDIKLLAEKYFAAVPKGTLALPSRNVPLPDLPARSKLREPRQQAILLMGFPGVSMLDERYDSINLLKDAMSGLSSKLNIEVRDKRGLTYYSGAFSMAGMDPGMYVLYAGTREDAVDEVESLMKKEIKRIISSGLSDEEVDRAKNRLISAYEKSLQNKMSVSMVCTLNELYGHGYEHIFSTPERYKALSPEAIKDAAKSILATDKYAVSLVLPERKEEQ